MTDLPTITDEDTEDPDRDNETDKTLAYILGRISGEIIED